jgi:hypothetical protein
MSEGAELTSTGRAARKTNFRRPLDDVRLNSVTPLLTQAEWISVLRRQWE